MENEKRVSANGHLGSKIRELRLGKGMTQFKLADTSGISEGCLRELEKGKTKRPTESTLVWVLQSLDVKPEDAKKLLETSGFYSVASQYGNNEQ